MKGMMAVDEMTKSSTYEPDNIVTAWPPNVFLPKAA